MNEDRCQCRIIHSEKVEAAKAAALDENELTDMVAFFKCFGDASRLRIFMALQQEEMCVCDIAAFLDITESAVSHQLRYLRTLRLVIHRREGTVLYYRLADEHVAEILTTGLVHVRE